MEYTPNNETKEVRSERPDVERILFVSETPIDDNYPNGVLTTAKKTLDYFEERGYQVKVVCPKTPTVSDEYASFPITAVRSAAVQGFPIGVGGANKIPKLVKKFKPDIVMSFSPFGFMSEHAINAARTGGIPLIENYQTDVVGYFDTSEESMLERYSSILKPDGEGEYTPPAQLARKLAVAALRVMHLSHHGKRIAKKRVAMLHNQADINLAPSSSARDEIISHGVREDSIRLWGRGVDMDTYHPRLRDTDEVRTLRDIILRGSTVPIVGYVGRVAPEKDVEDLASLLKLDIQLVIVGDGPSLDELKSKFGKAALFVGRQQNPALANFYAAFDIFVHTGKKETFGQTIQEAQATGIPAVAPGVGGPLSTIVHGDTGFLFSPHSKSDMVHVVERLVDNPELRRRIGAQARRSVERKSWSNLGRELEGYMGEAITLRKGTSLNPEK